MRMAASLPGGGASKLPVFLDVIRSHRLWWGFFCRDGGRFEAPIFGDVVFVFLHGLLFCLSPLKVERETSCHWWYPTSAEESNKNTILWLCKANDTGQRQRKKLLGSFILCSLVLDIEYPISQCNGRCEFSRLKWWWEQRLPLSLWGLSLQIVLVSSALPSCRFNLRCCSPSSCVWVPTGLRYL